MSHLKTSRLNREATINSYFEKLHEMNFRDGIKALKHGFVEWSWRRPYWNL